jgi:hypothetical protein
VAVVMGNIGVLRQLLLIAVPWRAHHSCARPELCRAAQGIAKDRYEKPGAMPGLGNLRSITILVGELKLLNVVCEI